MTAHTAGRCTEKVVNNYTVSQCQRNAVRDGYCKQHHPDAAKARRQAAIDRAEAARAASPFAKVCAERDALRAQRDELAAALRIMLGLETAAINGCNWKSGLAGKNGEARVAEVNRIFNYARAALAKLDGGK